MKPITSHIKNTTLLVLVVSIVACVGAPSGNAYISHTTPLKLAVQRAEAFWGGPPPCGQPNVVMTATPSEDEGMAIFQECRANINVKQWPSPQDIALEWGELCRVVTHEIGHLWLGANYYASVNPTNPAHSPVEQNVMYYNAATWGAYPSTCFPMTFVLKSGSIVHWFARKHKIEGQIWHIGTHEWETQYSAEGGNLTIEKPREARIIKPADPTQESPAS